MLVRVSPDQEKAFLAAPSGKFRVAPALKVIPVAAILACLYCYYMAVSKGEVKPFPNCTVTNTATPYPQDIVFRTIMTPCTIIFLIMWFVCYVIVKQYQPLSNKLKPIPLRIWWHGWLGSICFGITMATIDSGKMAGTLHSVCAVIFFILYLLNLRLVNIAYTELKTQYPNCITDQSLNYKKRVTNVIYAVVIYELLRLLFGEYIFGGTDKEICIIEWVAVFGFCFYFYSFSWDWKDYYLVLFVGQCASIDKSQN